MGVPTAAATCIRPLSLETANLAAPIRSMASSSRVLPAKSVLTAELLVRADDSPLRMNGSGLLLLNPPWQLDRTLEAVLPLLARALGETPAAGAQVTWLAQAEA